MQAFEAIMFLVFTMLLLSIFRSIHLHGGIRQSIKTFVDTAQNGGIILLFLLVIPVSMIVTYYALFMVPGFRENISLRDTIIRPSTGTLAIILTVFFLNGKLVRAIRGFANWSVRQWNKFGLFRT